MKPMEMKCVRIIGLKKDLQAVVGALHKSGLLHLKNTDYTNLPDSKYLAKHEQVSSCLVRVRAIIEALPPAPIAQQKSDSLQEYSLDSAVAAAELLEQLESEVRQVASAISERNEQHSKLVEQHAKLMHYRGIGFDFSKAEQSSLVEQKAFKAKKPELLAGILPPDKFETLVFPGGLVIAIGRKGAFSAVLHDLPEGVEELELPKGISDIDRELKTIEEKDEALRVSLNGRHGTLSDLSIKYYAKLLQLEEVLAVWHTRSEIMRRTRGTENFFLIEGYVPARRHAEFKEYMALASKAAGLAFEELPSDHHEPTFLDNSKLVLPFQNLLEFISLPRYSELDPTILIAFIIPVFYGMIIGDVGYGLVSFLLAWLLGRGAKGGLLKILTRIWMISAIPTIIFGIVFDEFFGMTHTAFAGYFGIQLANPLYLGFHRMSDPSQLIFITIMLGLAHLALGFILGAVNEWGHDKKHALAKLCWLGIEITGTVLVAAVFFNAGTVYLLPAAGLFLLFLIGLGATEGIISLCEVPGLASNAMSYLRIAAVGMAGVILAEIINELFLPRSKDPFIFLLTLVCYVVLHLTNTVIAMVEAFIHGARLNIVEFFMKFYKGNGLPYNPFKAEMKYAKEAL